MADSAFWRDLAAQFLLIPHYGMLRADGSYIIGSGEPWNWHFAGGSGVFVESAFETLARRGAAEIASAGTPDLLVFWLEELRKGNFNFRSSGIAREIQTDGTDGRQYMTGSIFALCEASATFCKKLEAQAVQAEFYEKHRNESDDRLKQPFESIEPTASPFDLEKEIERRKNLLADYKAATGNPSDYRIYNAANAGIHKPQFYQWRKGKLSARTKTARQFERFLREKKRPIPRKSTN